MTPSDDTRTAAHANPDHLCDDHRMIARLRPLTTRWTSLVPGLAVVLLAFTWGRDLPGAVVALLTLVLAGAVLAAVHHAEVVAHRVGEPFGSLVLAVAVTIIEVALIVTLMADGGDKSSTLARDTVFAAVMITCNGIAGLCLLVASLRHRTAVFNPEGTGAALATVATLATLSLVLPTFTTSKPGPEFSGVQLTFAAFSSLVLYGLFVATQTVRHRDYFLPITRQGEDHRGRPRRRALRPYRPDQPGAAGPGPDRCGRSGQRGVAHHRVRRGGRRPAARRRRRDHRPAGTAPRDDRRAALGSS
jgi:Ca2+:H+ antiporter